MHTWGWEGSVWQLSHISVQSIGGTLAVRWPSSPFLSSPGPPFSSQHIPAQASQLPAPVLCEQWSCITRTWLQTLPELASQHLPSSSWNPACIAHYPRCSGVINLSGRVPRQWTLKRDFRKQEFCLWLSAGLRETAAPFHQMIPNNPGRKARNVRETLLSPLGSQHIAISGKVEKSHSCIRTGSLDKHISNQNEFLCAYWKEI